MFDGNVHARGDFEAALKSHEKKHKHGYEKAHADVCIALLEQNPVGHAQCSSGKVATTLIQNMGVVWSFRRKRWLTAMELLALMGFPSYAALSALGETCSFSRQREEFGFPPRQRGTTCAQIGNSMFVPNAGMCLLYVCMLMPSSSSFDIARVGPRYDLEVEEPLEEEDDLLSLAAASASRSLKRHKSA